MHHLVARYFIVSGGIGTAIGVRRAPNLCPRDNLLCRASYTVCGGYLGFLLGVSCPLWVPIMIATQKNECVFKYFNKD